MAMTNAQKQAKHRLAVKERLARYEGALRDIERTKIWDNKSSLIMRQIAREALSLTDPAKTP